MNTPYLLRDLEKNYLDNLSDKARMVSAQPVNSLNKADAWEAGAIESLAHGFDKVSVI